MAGEQLPPRFADRVDRWPIPAFIRDLWADPRAFRLLIVAAASLLAAGLNPVATSPSLPSIQSAIRAQPEINALLILVTLVAAALLFIGGVLADTHGRRGLLLGALGVLVIANGIDVVIGAGLTFVVSRFVATAAAYAVLPFGLALVATAYGGLVRATAIGIVYAAYGAGTAISPVLMTLLGPSGPTWPAFLVAALGAALALWVARPRAPDLSPVDRSDRGYVVATAIWSFAIVVLTAAILDIGGRISGALRPALIGLGLALLLSYGGYLWRQRVRGRTSHLHVVRRPMTVAVAIGVVIGFSQAAPMFQLPIYFYLVMGFGAIGATLATVPFILALVVAGPIAGLLLARLSPRRLIAGGTGLVGAGNIIAALVLGQSTPYAALVVPPVLIGGGFVVATTVRTAIIFASTPRRLPGSAAALNEASVLVGSRVGLAALTAVITQRGLDIYAASLSTTDPAQRDRMVAAFHDVLVAIGTPALSEVVGTVQPADLSGYVVAITQAYQEALFGTGVLALVAGAVAWVALGPQDPLTTVWDHADERQDDD